MNDKEIINYWYKYLHKNYPFIQWKLEAEVNDQLRFNPILLKIQATNPVCGLRVEIIQSCMTYNDNRNLATQNKMIANEIKRLVVSLKTRSAQKLKQDMP